MNKKRLIWMIVIVLVFVISSFLVLAGSQLPPPETPPGPSCTCNSCSECSDILNTGLKGGLPCIIVNLSQDISTTVNCIYVSIKEENGTLNCNGYKISKTGSRESSIGIQVSANKAASIQNCVIKGFYQGINAYSSNVTYYNNTIHDNTWGIYYGNSENNLFHSNILYENNYAFDWASTGSTFFTFFNNTFFENLYPSEFFYLSNSEFFGNKMYNDKGILIRASNNKIYENLFYNNSGYALNITSTSSNNSIYDNFFNNTYNAYDAGNNFWNTTKNCSAGPNIIDGPCIGGNYWSDYAGADTNGDGIGETTYSISGGSNYDYLPLTGEADCTCDSCSNCNTKLNAGYCSEVFLVDNITEVVSSGSKCININSVNDTIFNCQNNTINQHNDYIGDGIGVWSEEKNITVKNCIVNDFSSGIYLYFAENNVLINNKMNNNTYNLNILGSRSSTTWHYHDIDSSNLVDGKPVYYWTDRANAPNGCSNAEINESHDVGLVALISCDNITVKNLNLSNNGDALLLHNTANSTIKNNFLHSTWGGLRVYYSSNNVFSNNTIYSNEYSGIYITGNSLGKGSYNIFSNNTIYDNNYGVYLEGARYNTFYNNFFNNTNNYVFSGSAYINYLNTTRTHGQRIYSKGNEIGGNYWANPSGTGFSETCNDTNTDGFCDYNYTLASNNVDFLPLSNKYYNATNCSSCTECSNALNALHYTHVFLNQSINSSGSGCIGSVTNFNDKTFDCQGHTIEGGSGAGISLSENKDNTIKNCIVTDFSSGIAVSSSSSNNLLLNNTLTSNSFAGIFVSDLSFNNILQNNTISSNTGNGIRLAGAVHTSLKNNKMNNNSYNLYVLGSTDSEFYHDIDSSNLVDGKPVYYWTDQANAPNGCSNAEINESHDAGLVALISCDNITVKNLNLSNNNKGIFLRKTNNSNIFNNTISLTDHALELQFSNNNNLTGNTAFSNNRGIIVWRYSGSNYIYNNFFNNTNNHYFISEPILKNFWNISKTLGKNIVGGVYIGGNFWSNYAGEDTDGDGIGEDPYIMNTNNTDYLPLTFDTFPPVTTDNSSNATPLPWYNADVLIQLNATDYGSGLNKTFYCLQNISDSNCNPSTISYAPGFMTVLLTNITLSCPENNACQYKIRYYSVDNADNTETTKESNPIYIVKNSSVSNTTAYNCSIYNQSLVQDAICNHSVIDNSTKINTTLINSINTKSQVFDTYEEDAIITDCFVQASTITNSTLKKEDIYLRNCVVIGSTIEDSTLTNVYSYNSFIDPSTVIESLIINSTVTNATIKYSQIEDSNISCGANQTGIIEVYSAGIQNNVLSSGKITYNGYTYHAPFNMSDICAGILPVPVGELRIVPQVSKTGDNSTIYYSGSSTGFIVTADTSAIGGTTVSLKDDGIYPDETEDDAIYTAIQAISSGIGYETITATINDNKGNTFSASANIFIDDIPPNASITINNGDIYTKTREVQLYLNYSDNYGVDKCRYGNNLIELSAYAWEACADTKFWRLTENEEEKTVFYEVMDLAGNTITVNDSIIYDQTPPTINITYPTPGSTLSGIVNITFVGVETNSEISIDGAAWVSTDSSFWHEWNTSAIIDGAHTLQIRGYDNAGNLGYSNTILVYTQNYLGDEPFPPVVTDQGDYTKYDTWLYATWTQSYHPYANPSYYYNVYNETDGSYLLPNWLETTNLYANITGLNLAEGKNYTIRVKAHIYTGANSTESSSNGIVVDITNPQIGFLNSTTHPNNIKFYADNNPIFVFNSTDVLSGVAGYSYVLDEKNSTNPPEIIMLASNGTLASRQFFGIADGTYYFHLRAADRAGNFGATQRFMINIETGDLSVKLYQPRTPSYSAQVDVYGYVGQESNITLKVNDTVIETKHDVAKGEFVFENVPLSIGQNIIKANITSGSLQKTSNAVAVLRKPVSNITLTVSYSEAGGAQKTNHLVYSSEGNIKVGIATENPSPDISEVGPIYVLNTNPQKDSTYIFVTPSSAKPEAREAELAKYTFLEEEHPFFFTKKYSSSPEYIISTALNYEHIIIQGLQKVSAGNHILVIENLGVSNGKTIVKIEIR